MSYRLVHTTTKKEFSQKLLKPGIAATAEQKMFTERQNKPTSFVQASSTKEFS